MVSDKTKIRPIQKWLFRTWFVATALWLSYWAYQGLIGNLESVSSAPRNDGEIDFALAELFIIPPLVIYALIYSLVCFVSWAFECFRDNSSRLT